jgi:predicted TIM-barrel fold metal-dependent hydrolase
MPIIDSHVVLEGSVIPGKFHSAPDLCGLLTERGIDIAVVRSARAGMVDPIAGNRILKSVLDMNPTLLGCVTAHLGRPKASLEAIKEHLGSRRFVASMLVGSNPLEPLNPLIADEILNGCRRYQKPIFIYSPNAACDAAGLALARAYTMHRFVLIGMGGQDWHTAVAAAHQVSNIYLEISGALDVRKVPAAIEDLGSHRLIFGSGLPVCDPMAILGLLDDSSVRPNDRRRILFDNPEKLYGLEAAE